MSGDQTAAPPAVVAGLAAWIAFLEQLRPDSLDRLTALTTPTVRFKDPFNDVRGHAALRAVLHHTLESSRDLSFQVSHQALAADRLALLRWRFGATVPVLGRLDITGMSEVALDDDGRVASHIDHWDSGTAVYLRLPLIGGPLRLIRRLLAGPAGRGTPSGP